MKLNEIPKDRPADGSGSGHVPASAYEPVFTAPQDPTAKLSPLKDFSEKTVLERMEAMRHEEVRRASTIEMTLRGTDSGENCDPLLLIQFFAEIWNAEIVACIAVLDRLAQPSAPNFRALAEELEHARAGADKKKVEFLNYLARFPRLQAESILRDDLINGNMLNAAHRLRSLDAWARTGTDPDAPEVLKECAHAD